MRVQCGDETRRHRIRVVVRDCRFGWDVGRWIGRGIFTYMINMKGVLGAFKETIGDDWDQGRSRQKSTRVTRIRRQLNNRKENSRHHPSLRENKCKNDSWRTQRGASGGVLSTTRKYGNANDKRDVCK